LAIEFSLFYYETLKEEILKISPIAINICFLDASSWEVKGLRSYKVVVDKKQVLYF
jgi:hypothetical protein